MARYPNATWRPTDKHGYPGNDNHLHQGLVIHSAEGSLAGLFSVLDGSRQASWHFSMAQDGSVYQHVDTSNIAWTNGSFDSNTRFWGIECEGGGPGNLGEPLTEPQYQSLMGVVWWLWETHGLTRYERQQTLWEHNEMTRFGASSTSCPSGRIPWDRLMMESQEDDMDDARVIELINAHVPKVRFKPPGHSGADLKAWIASYHKHRLGYGGTKRNHIDTPAFIRKGSGKAVYMAVGGALFHIPNFATLKEMYRLYGTGQVRSLPATNPIWKLPKFSIS